MNITENKIRIGNFTSSEIVALTTKDRSGKGFGAPAKTYILEKNMERMLGRCLKEESNARPLTWGKLLENRVFSLLGLDYTLTSDITIAHPSYDFWVGSPDGFHEGQERAVTDIKCPITLKSFIQLVLPLYCGLTGLDAINAIRNGFTHNGFEYPAHTDGEKYYTQLLSNATTSNCDFAELIVYMPYKSELDDIRKLADGETNAYWIWAAADNELPYLPDNGMFNNINIIRFPILPDEKERLTACVIDASQLLIP